MHGWKANHSPDRLTLPLLRKDGLLQVASWDEAMSLIVTKSKETRENYTSSAIGFYTSGQLFLEEYYTFALIGKGGLGTPHMDGNTRLCTATAGEWLKQTFGSDGQPGTYYDIDETECLFLVGHNMAETATVLWSRVLDRLRGPRPPKLIVIDPRATATARAADIHLAPRIGTNVALLNGLLHLVIAAGQVDRSFIDKHTMGFDALRETVEQYPPERVEAITGIGAGHIQEAADILGRTQSLLSTCLQGVYQSMQATAAAVQVNNLNLVRGMIGRSGCGVLQMNGQPTSQNTRETGADGDLPGFRNWDNPKHIEELAQIWNVDIATMPHWAPPTHALEIFHLAETGSIRMLWISATNPAVLLPSLPRVRKIFRSATSLSSSRMPSSLRLHIWRMWCCQLRCGERRQEHSPTSIAPYTSATRRSILLAMPARISTSSLTTRGGWTSATRMARRLSSGQLQKRHSRHGRTARWVDLVTIQDFPTQN